VRIARRGVFAVASAAALAAVCAAASSSTEAARGQQDTCAPRWRVVASGAGVPDLHDVAAVSPTDVWVVGARGPQRKSVIARWDGRKLRIVREFKTLGILGIAAASANDLWAVGYDGKTERPLVMRWNGRRWRIVATPRLRFDAHLADIVTLSRNDVWVVGTIGASHFRPLFVHWDGRRLRVRAIWHEGSLGRIDGTASGPV
jgi:hypothetical protein